MGLSIPQMSFIRYDKLRFRNLIYKSENLMSVLSGASPSGDKQAYTRVEEGFLTMLLFSHWKMAIIFFSSNMVARKLLRF